MKELKVRLQQRHHLAAIWTSANPILAEGEMGVETDTGKFKIGTGRHRWNALDYAQSKGIAQKIFNGYDNEKTGEAAEQVGDLTNPELVFKASIYKAEDHPGEIIIVPRKYEPSGASWLERESIIDTPYISLRKNNKWFWVVFSDQKNKALASSALGSFVLGTSTLG